jgi:hypothetical protein
MLEMRFLKKLSAFPHIANNCPSDKLPPAVSEENKAEGPANRAF